MTPMGNPALPNGEVKLHHLPVSVSGTSAGAGCHPKFPGTFPIPSVSPPMKTKTALAAAAWPAHLLYRPGAGCRITPGRRPIRSPASPRSTSKLRRQCRLRPCDCHEIRIHVELVGQKLSDYRLEEGQSGDEVHFLFKELPHIGVHITWHREQTRVTVETPASSPCRPKPPTVTSP